MNKLDEQYLALLGKIYVYGHQKETRNGTVKSIFGATIQHYMGEGFPLLTTKRMYWKGIVTELLWFLRGDTNIKYLIENDCHIWTGDAYRNYCDQVGKYKEPDYDVHVEDVHENRVRLMTKDEFSDRIKNDAEFCKKWGELGPIYGKQWRRWKIYNKKDLSHVTRTPDLYQSSEWIDVYDQINKLITELKTNPDSRRLIVNAWNVGDLDEMVLPPCHYSFQIYTRELTEHERYELLSSDENYIHHVMDDRNIEDDPLAQFDIPDRAISLMWNQRSVDLFLGLPFNIASYGLLLEIIAQEVGMKPEMLIGNLGDVHIYDAHETAVRTQMSRVDKIHRLPTLNIKATKREHPNFAKKYNPSDFEILNYTSEPSIKAPLIN